MIHPVAHRGQFQRKYVTILFFPVLDEFFRLSGQLFFKVRNVHCIGSSSEIRTHTVFVLSEVSPANWTIEP